jgi:hypothetical protein
MKIWKISDEYINEISNLDKNISYNKNSTRPYVGVLFKIDKLQYFAPLSSPKPKHLTMKTDRDFVKIDGGKLGVINLNNMLPICDNSMLENMSSTITLEMNKEQRQYALLLSNQLVWIKNNKSLISIKAGKLHSKYLANKLPNNIKKRCVNFVTLEKFLSSGNK